MSKFYHLFSMISHNPTLKTAAMFLSAIGLSNTVANASTAEIPDMVGSDQGSSRIAAARDEPSDIYASKSSIIATELATFTLTVANPSKESVSGTIVKADPGDSATCEAGSLVRITGQGAPLGRFTIADLIGDGIKLETVPPGSAVILSFKCPSSQD